MNIFDHERLDVYQASISFIIISEKIVSLLPKGCSFISNQLQRAAISIPLNIAEGAGEFSSADKARFYRIAKRCATECAAIVDICGSLKIAEEELLFKARNLLLRIVSMLIKLAKKHSGTGTSGTGKGTFK